MPIIKSAKKQLRQNVKKNARNSHFKALYREARVAFEKAIKAGDLKAAKEVYFSKSDKDGKNIKSGLQSIIDKLIKKNIIHLNNGSRKKSHFVKMMKELDTKKA
jgi:small subunit ribosomal protein S20